MESIDPDVLDCKVEIRKYVLVSQPKRWRRKGHRVVVQSPMLEISKSTTHVPVRCFRGEEENGVCFLEKSDIEKDSSKIYGKLQVGQTTTWINAHGVALLDSTEKENNNFSLEYRRGHRFWIYIGAVTDNYEKTIPVINLDTFKSGTIPIDHVCWYPKIQVGEELWTLGGETRKMRLSGPGNCSYWSWIVVQDQDGYASTRNEQIPNQEVEIEGARLLSSTEARSLFERVLRSEDDWGRTEESDLYSKAQRAEHSMVSETTQLLPPTPPASPPEVASETPRNSVVQENSVRKWPHLPPSKYPISYETLTCSLFTHLSGMLREISTLLSARIQEFHYREMPSTLPSKTQQCSLIVIDVEEGNEPDDSDSSDESLSMPSSTNEPTLQPDVCISDPRDALLPNLLFRTTDESRRHRSVMRPGISVTSPDIINGTISIREHWEGRNSQTIRPMGQTLNLCQSGVPECGYNKMNVNFKRCCDTRKEDEEARKKRLGVTDLRGSTEKKSRSTA